MSPAEMREHPATVGNPASREIRTALAGAAMVAAAMLIVGAVVIEAAGTVVGIEAVEKRADEESNGE